MEEEWREIREWTEEEDLGGIEACLLTDLLHETLSELDASYTLLCEFEEEQPDPDQDKIRKWDERAMEVFRFRNSLCGESFADMRRWIRQYSREVKEVHQLRAGYGN